MDSSWKLLTRRFNLRTRQQELIVRLSVLTLIYILAFCIRLFSVLRYESVIHEFDPYFNYRSTIKLVQEGMYEFWNWFDADSWYPLGRVIGGTVYPGLMFTAALIYRGLEALTLTVSLRDVCVLTAPFFAGNTAMVAYLFGKKMKDSGTGLVAALLMSIAPGYISRSVAGSFDNEAVAIFALLTTFYLWVCAVSSGDIMTSVLCAFAYFYMASAWGAYVFISNLIPLYTLLMLAIGRYSRRLYVAYTTVWVVGSLLAIQIRFIGFNHILSNELLAFNAVFVLLQVLEVLRMMRGHLGPRLFAQFVTLTLMAGASAVGAVFVLGILTGKVTPWTGRFWTLLDPTYAKKFIPIIASVSEHQPTTWANYIFDLHILVFAAPAGMYFCFKELDDVNIFVLTFALASIYFSGIMVRLMLVAAPAFVLLASLAISITMKNSASDLRSSKPAPPQEVTQTKGSNPPKAQRKKVSKSAAAEQGNSQRELSMAVLALAGIALLFYTQHCQWVTSEAYSSPSIVLIGGKGPHRWVLDDFREAYYWLRHNTAPDARIMSWWDYGYQITAMGNRTVIVDNNTWNNTHIATVGRAMASKEEDAYQIMRLLDVDYVLVIFGGTSGYSSDDINKFLWMVRIGGGVFPTIQEKDYFSASGEYTVSKDGSDTMLNCLMYKLSYYDFDKVMTSQGVPTGYDRVRHYEIGKKDIQLTRLEEAFTSENWIVRIYKVKDLENTENWESKPL